MSRRKEWKENGSYGMLLITETEIYFVYDGHKTENDDWDIISGVCCNRKRRDFFNQTRQSKEMKESAREDLIGIGMIINNDTGSFEEMYIKDTVKDTIVLREYLQYEIPLTNNSIEELIDMDKETGLEWNLKRLKI